MDPGKILWEQSIAGHGHENARLSKLENEQDRSHAGQCAGANESLRPWFARERGGDRRGIAQIDRVFLHPG